MKFLSAAPASSSFIYSFPLGLTGIPSIGNVPFALIVNVSTTTQLPFEIFEHVIDPSIDTYNTVECSLYFGKS
jgi:hypothetical protein